MTAAGKRSATRRYHLNLRNLPADLQLIARAALATGKTRAAIILKAARRAAEEALLDRFRIVVNPTVYAELLQRQDQPAQPNIRLRRAMRGNTEWQEF